MTEMSKFNGLGVKKYFIIVEWNQWQIRCLMARLYITDQNNYKWERNGSYFIDFILSEGENSNFIKNFVV